MSLQYLVSLFYAEGREGITHDDRLGLQLVNNDENHKAVKKICG